MIDTDSLRTIALRGWIEAAKKEVRPDQDLEGMPITQTNHRGRALYPLPKRPSLVMVLDTETTLDELQNLSFGHAMVYERKHGQRGYSRDGWEPILDILFYHDEASEEEKAVLTAYAKEHW